MIELIYDFLAWSGFFSLFESWWFESSSVDNSKYWPKPKTDSSDLFLKELDIVKVQSIEKNSMEDELADWAKPENLFSKNPKTKEELIDGLVDLGFSKKYCETLVNAPEKVRKTYCTKMLKKIEKELTIRRLLDELGNKAMKTELEMEDDSDFDLNKKYKKKIKLGKKK